MPGLWKAWKANSGLPTLTTSPLEISPKAVEIPTFPRLRRRGRMEKWKTKGRFPTFPAPLRDDGPWFRLSKPKNRPLGGLVPAIAAALRAASGVIVVDREK